MLSATAKRHHLYILISIQSNSWIHMHLNFGLFANITRVGGNGWPHSEG